MRTRTSASPSGTPCGTSAASTKPSSPPRSAPGTAATPASPTPTNTRTNSCNRIDQGIEPAQPNPTEARLARRLELGRAAIDDVLGNEERREGHTVLERVFQPACLSRSDAIVGALLRLDD